MPKVEKELIKQCLETVNHHIVPGSRYKHFKGGEYTITPASYHTEDNYVQVNYMDDEGILYSRPYMMFIGHKVIDGELVQRFIEIESTITK